MELDYAAYQECGNLNMDFHIRLSDETETQCHIFYMHKDAFTEDVISLEGMETWTQWNYTTASGEKVLIFRSPEDWRGFLFCDMPNYTVTLRYTFIHEQYFNHVIDGDVAAQEATLAAIAEISMIPERVMWEHGDIVAAAREAYNKVATKDQQALVANYNGVDYYSILDKAEQRIKKQKPCDCGVECGCEVGSGCVCGVSCCDSCGCMPVDPIVGPDNTVDSWKIIAIVALCLVAVAGIVIVVLFVRMRKPADVAEEIPTAEVAAEETQVEEEASAEPETEETTETE
jgi:hypothetical protein